MRHSLVRALAALLVAAPVAAQGTPHAGAWVIRLGTDTLGVERFQRRGNAYDVEQVRRSPNTALFHTHLALSAPGEIADIFYMHHDIPADRPLLASIRLQANDSGFATVTRRRGDSVQVRRIAVRPGLVPALPQSWLAYEMATMRFRAAGGDSMRVTLMGPGGDSSTLGLRRHGADSVLIRAPFTTYRARVDAEGRILAMHQPLGTSIERVPAVDPNALAARWKADDDAGRGFGQLSPYDSAIVSVGAARMTVHYSRPKMRGRPVWGGMAPFDAVWRTGANDATIFSTDRELQVGGATVPAGRYSVWSIPTANGMTLILNRETTRDGRPLGGGDYDPQNDVARVPLRVARAAQPVEQFTIEIVPGSGNRATLRLAWADRDMTVPVVVR